MFLLFYYMSDDKGFCFVLQQKKMEAQASASQSPNSRPINGPQYHQKMGRNVRVSTTVYDTAKAIRTRCRSPAVTFSVLTIFVPLLKENLFSLPLFFMDTGRCDVQWRHG